MTAPHPVDENPEDHIGDEIPDPWADPDQTDWPANVVGDEEVNDGVGSSAESE